ncbi:MAG: SAM-dependent methyltransferase [Thermoplasmata archaeon]
MAGRIPHDRDTEPLSEEELQREARLRRRLLAAADPAGFLPFDRFMEVTLYDPTDGFYTHAGRMFGPGGDFYTAAHVTPVFGETIGRHIRELYSAAERPRDFRIVELGSGDGILGEGIVRGFAQGGPAPNLAEYRIVERSDTSRSESLARIAQAAQPYGISVRAAAAVSEGGPFEGVVLANELLDALPTRRLRYRAERWLEVGVRLHDGALDWQESENLRPLSGPPLPVRAGEGTIFEYSPLAEGLLREIADHLTAGRALFFDYGMEETELLKAHPGGSLAAVRRHRSVPDPLSSPGLVDLTTFVNFTRIRQSAARSGLVPLPFRPQREVLVDWGFADVLAHRVQEATSSEEEVRRRLAAKNLLFGFDRFYALEFATAQANPVTSSVTDAPA